MVADGLAPDFAGDDKPMTLFMALRWVSHTAGDRLWSFGHYGDANVRFEASTDGSAVDVYRRNAASQAASLTGSAAWGTSPLIGRFQFSGTTMKTYLDGALDIDGALRFVLDR